VYLTTLKRDLTISNAHYYPTLFSLPLLLLRFHFYLHKLANVSSKERKQGTKTWNLALIILTVHLHEFNPKIVFHYQISLLKLPKLFLGASGKWNIDVTGLYKFPVSGTFQII